MRQGHSCKKFSEYCMYTASFIPYKLKTLRKHSNSNMNKISNSGFDKENKVIFFHLLYYSREISQKRICHIYNKICNEPDERDRSFQDFSHENYGSINIKKITITYQHDKNLCD